MSHRFGSSSLLHAYDVRFKSISLSDSNFHFVRRIWVIWVCVATWQWEIEILFQRSLRYKTYIKICVGRRNSLKAETIFRHFEKINLTANQVNEFRPSHILMHIERPFQSYIFCTKVTSGTKFRVPSVRLLDIYHVAPRGQSALANLSIRPCVNHCHCSGV